MNVFTATIFRRPQEQEARTTAAFRAVSIF
jgi:hypothetical protein